MELQSNSNQGLGLSVLHQRAKAAMHYTAPDTQNQAGRVAASNLLSLLGIGVAGGAGIRGLMGMRDLMAGSQIPTSPSYNLPHAITVYGRPSHPAVGAEDEDEEMAKLPGPTKTAFDMQKTLSNAGNWLHDQAEHAPDTLAKMLPETHTLHPLMNEWGMPLGVTALGGGALGGWGLMNWLLDKQKQTAGANELEGAKDEYHQALAQQYRAAMMAKNANDDLGLNTLADEVLTRLDAVDEAHGTEKRAFTMSALGAVFPELDKFYSNSLGYDRWQAVKGGFNTAGLLATLGAGKLSYDWAKGQNKQELLAKALKRRQLARQQLSPPPIVALTSEENPDAG